MTVICSSHSPLPKSRLTWIREYVVTYSWMWPSSSRDGYLRIESPSSGRIVADSEEIMLLSEHKGAHWAMYSAVRESS